ncbi:MAG: cobalt ECF transporter T component CbiQ [Halorhabdus sp.]
MSRADTVDRSVAALAGRTRTVLRGDELARRDGWLQSVHPVIVLVGLFALIVLTVTFDTPGPPAGVLVLAGGFAVASRIPLRSLALRVVPPAGVAFVVVSPQLVLLEGTGLLGPITDPGATYVATFVLRVAAAVALLGLLIVTTRFAALTDALRVLRVPRTAVTLLTITHRYLLVVFDELARLVLARRSRRIRPATLRTSWQEAGSLLGTFFLRALSRGERVGRAARARGGTTGRSYPRLHPISLADVVFAFVVCATLAAGVSLA